jgi:hypothetical protein
VEIKDWSAICCFLKKRKSETRRQADEKLSIEVRGAWPVALLYLAGAAEFAGTQRDKRARQAAARHLLAGGYKKTEGGDMPQGGS